MRVSSVAVGAHSRRKVKSRAERMPCCVRSMTNELPTVAVACGVITLCFTPGLTAGSTAMMLWYSRMATARPEGSMRATGGQGKSVRPRVGSCVGEKECRLVVTGARRRVSQPRTATWPCKQGALAVRSCGVTAPPAIAILCCGRPLAETQQVSCAAASCYQMLAV